MVPLGITSGDDDDQGIPSALAAALRAPAPPTWRPGIRGDDSHAEPRMPDGFDGGGWPTDLNVCRALTTEEIEQQFARESDDANRGSPAPGSDDTVRPSPLELEPSAA